MTHFVIHIGPPKTGTKYLQFSLLRTRDQLGRHGVHYPKDIDGRDAILHDGLCRSLQEGKLRELILYFYALSRADHAVTILSCEGFNALTIEEIDLLKRLLGGATAEIIFMRGDGATACHLFGSKGCARGARKRFASLPCAC